LSLFNRSKKTFVEVILPLNLPQTYTYVVPYDLVEALKPGMRVEVQLGRKKIYAGIAQKLHNIEPLTYKVKPINAILDDEPIVTQQQLLLWEWIATYYMSNLGAVMNASMPSALKLTSETRIVINPNYEGKLEGLDEKAYMVAEALEMQNELTIADLQAITQSKSTYLVLKQLIDNGIAATYEELQNRYKPKTADFVLLNLHGDDELRQAFDLLEKRSPKQLELLMTLYQWWQKNKEIQKTNLLKATKASAQSLKALADKKYILIENREVDRLPKEVVEKLSNIELSPLQQDAFLDIKLAFKKHNVCLFHGVTGSGKTEVYIQLIKEQIAKQNQVLYMLPEIALTSQIIERLKIYFGDKVGIYHSKFNNQERVEIWQKVLKGDYKVLVGARSSLLLPFTNLGLIIIDEEHDHSFKQFNPTPRYQARDAAIYCANLFKAKVLLGTATPSLESYINAKQNKYGLVHLTERYGNAVLPKLIIANVQDEKRRKTMQTHFTSTLLKAIREALDNNNQVILFQNRRGFAPYLSCPICEHVPQCTNCDVSLTYHKFSNDLRCHLCGYRTKNPAKCVACGHTGMEIKGFGTEKIEDDLSLLLPNAKVGRMDYDSVKTKFGHHKIIQSFENREIDILVGTQMVTKGLDFDNVSLVGVMSADQILNYPDFRAAERAFQLLTQVSGRAGRRGDQGTVIIQASNVTHPVLKKVLEEDIEGFFEYEITQRQQFKYPPYYRLIYVTVKSKNVQLVESAAKFLGAKLHSLLGSRVHGPSLPLISKIRLEYLRNITIKMDRKGDSPAKVKEVLQQQKDILLAMKEYRSVKVAIDVDPY